MLGGGVSPEMIFAGNGSDEVLSFVFYAFFDSIPPPFPRAYLQFLSGVCRLLRYSGDQDSSLKRFFNRWRRYLRVRERSDFRESERSDRHLSSARQNQEALDSVPRDRVVVVDEAYIDFGGDRRASLAEYPNLAIVRTFSNSYCFAGARLGLSSRTPADTGPFHDENPRSTTFRSMR